VIFVRLGFVTVKNVLQVMHALVAYGTQYALNVKEAFGTTVDEFSIVDFVRIFFVKMINLNTKLVVKFWKRKVINVYRVIN